MKNFEEVVINTVNQPIQERIFIGNVYEREIDYGNELEFITVAANRDESLSDVLDDFIGEKVKITITVIKE